MTPRIPVGLAFIVAVAGACVIAEPPRDLPTLPAEPPAVARSGVVPTPNVVLSRWPEKFVLPVRLSDPQASVVYSYFIDYNSITGDGWISSDVSAPVIGASPGAQRNLEIAIPEPSSDRCHVVEIVVALNLNPFLDGRNAHTPLAPGGDSVTWFYSPGGTLMGCPTIDAKLQPDATALDAIRDGGGL